MAKIPQVMRSVQDPQLSNGAISQEQFKGDDSLSKAISFVSDATAEYALNEKKQFDLARLTEARNLLDAHESRLSSDEKSGYQNKLGQSAVVFRDEDGNDFMTHYSSQYQNSIRDVETQLQLTPDQKKVFDEYAQSKSIAFTDKLLTHQLRQGKEYKVSVFENAVAVSAKKAEGLFTDPAEMQKTIEQLTADYNALGDELGWSEVEKSRKTSDAINTIHGNTLKVILDSGDFITGEAYLKQYGGNMSELQKVSADSSIRKMKNDYATAQLMAIETEAMLNNSNPAFNTSDTNAIKAVSKIDPVEYGSLRYDDPRLDGLAVVNARELGMDWAIPLVTAIRVVGEKSHNGQKSSANAKGVYQITPIAIEQIRIITGKTIDPTNPDEASWGALKLIDWISKKYNTKDPAIIASYYNGGGQFVGQLKKGGADAITNKENRDYVKRVLGFDFSEYASKPVAGDGLNYNLKGYTPENQAKLLANRAKVRAEKKKAEEEQQKMAFENASDMIVTGAATYEQLVANPKIVKFLSSSQLKTLKDIDKAKKSESSATLVARVYQNPTELKGMPQSQFNQMIEFVGDSEKKELSKLYAEANGRTIKDANDAEKAAKPKSAVTHQLVFNAVESYASSLGFSGTSKSNKKLTNANTDSGMFVAIKDNIYASVVAADQRFFAANKRYMSDLEVRNYIKNELGRTKTVTNDGIFSSNSKSVPLYSPDTKRSEVNSKTNEMILNMAVRSGQGYKKVDDIPDSVYWQYYYRAWRR